MKLFGVALFTALLFVAAGSVTRAAESDVTVTGAVVNVRSEPSKSAPVLRQAKAGETFRLLETKGEWYAVELPGGPRGFLHRSVVRVGPAATTAKPEAPAAAPASTGPAPATGASTTSAGGVAIAHETIDCVVADRFPRVEARLDPVERVARVRARFRVAGAVHWYSVEMKAQEGTFAALLPKPKKQTPRIEYYIEAIDTEFGASQTAEHGADVVASPAECSKKVVAAALSAGKVAVTAPAGAPPVPAGFSSSGVTSASASGAAAGGAAAGAGLSATTIGLIAGGGALAVGAGVAVAKGGSDNKTPAPPPVPLTCSTGQLVMDSLRFQVPVFTCPRGTAADTPYQNDLLVEAINNSPVEVTLGAATATFTVTGQTGNATCRGGAVPVTGTPASVGQRGRATVRFPVQFFCTSGGGGASCEFGASLALQTSCGAFTVPAINSHRLILE